MENEYYLHKKAFTLIELLVVIAIIALLMAVIIPALSLARKKAAAVLCLSNVRSVSLATFSYTEDNNGYIYSAEMGGYTEANGKQTTGWTDTPHTEAGVYLSPVSSNVVTDADEIRGLEDGALFTSDYLNEPKVFNCPADKVKALDIYDTVDPEKFVTYAVPVCLGGNNIVGGVEHRIRKLSEVTSPSGRYMLVETAEERNFTMAGHFVFGAPEWTNGGPAVWWGPMAVNHGDSSDLGFMDGHAERHKWQDDYTKERVEKLSQQQTTLYQLDTASGINSDNSEDIAYMARGWPYRYKP